MEPTESIGNQLFFAFKRYNNQLNKQSTDLSIEHYYPIFHYISEQNGPVTQQGIADHFAIDKSTITRIIDYFIGKKLLSKERCKNDKRKSYLLLTEQGEKEMTQLNVIYKILNVKSLDEIPKNDIETFQKVLSQIKVNLERIEL